MHANYLDTLDWGILIAYFLILIGIGIWASLKRKKGSSLFLAERSLKWHHIGFSMWGTNVGPSMLIASASAGFTTGIVSGNYAWYAFVFICLLAFVFAPRYLGARITHLAGVHGAAFRTVHPQHSCLVHHCDNPYLVACPDLIRRRYPYPSGFRYSHVAVSIDPARYLRILHHGRRAESGSLYQCIPNASAYFRIGHAYYSRSLQSGWHQRIGRSGSGRLLEPVPPE